MWRNSVNNVRKQEVAFVSDEKSYWMDEYMKNQNKIVVLEQKISELEQWIKNPDMGINNTIS